MKKIQDERLIGQNLKNIRTSMIIENGFIIIVLIWQAIHNKDLWQAITYDNPLFVALMIGALTLTIRSINISTPIEDRPKRSWQRIGLYAGIEFVGFSIFFYLIFVGSHPVISLLAGAIVTAVPTGMLLYSNHLR